MLDASTLRVAARQFGVVDRRQLTDDLGWSASAIARARRAGLFVELAPGVLQLASQRDTFAMRCMAAQLSTGAIGFLSGWTAARMYGLRRMSSDRVHYTVPHRSRAVLPDFVDRHRSRWYDHERDSVLRSDGFRIATPIRMLFGLAADVNQFRFERAAEDAWHLQLISPAEAAEYLELHRCRGKNGVGTMERWLERFATIERPAQSGLEQDLLAELDLVGLPPAERQHPLTLASGEIIHLDIAWPAIRYAVEPGHSWWHGGDFGQRGDQARDRECGEVGWMITRFDQAMRADLVGAAGQVGRIYRRRADDLRSGHAIAR